MTAGDGEPNHVMECGYTSLRGSLDYISLSALRFIESTPSLRIFFLSVFPNVFVYKHIKSGKFKSLFTVSIKQHDDNSEH